MTEKERELFEALYKMISKSTAAKKHNEGNENYHTIVPFELIFYELTREEPNFEFIEEEVSSVIRNIEENGDLLTENEKI